MTPIKTHLVPITTFFVLIISVPQSATFTSTRIPQHLNHCYNTSRTQWPIGTTPPHTHGTLVELIRKLENARSSPNLRLFSNALLHSAKLDGIRHGPIAPGVLEVPYRASGFEFHRHQLLVDQLTPGEVLGPEFPPVLTQGELCLLHRLVSETLNPDGNELGGVVMTPYGSVRMGPLVAGIASALQRERVGLAKLLVDITSNESKDNETIRVLKVLPEERVDNVWFATLAGVLAQGVLNQATSQHFRFLSEGTWDDDVLPQRYFLKDPHWDLNDATILGAVDGLILSLEVRKWLEQFPAARLSQIIDMYYSFGGIRFDRSVRPADRRAKMEELFDLHNVSIQVSASAKLLQQFGNFPYIIPEDKLESLSSKIVEEFRQALDADRIPNMDFHVQDNVPVETSRRHEIILVPDHMYSLQDIRELISGLSMKIDISEYGSSIGLLNGNTAKWLLHVNTHLVEIFANLTQITINDWPTSLSLTHSLHEIIDFLQTEAAITRCYQRPTSKLIVILTRTSHLTDTILANANASIASIRRISPGARILFLTSPSNEISYKPLGYHMNVLQRTARLKSDSLKEILEVLDLMPADIGDQFCGNGDKDGRLLRRFEDYLNPDIPHGLQIYAIDAMHAGRANISIKFLGRGYGDVEICAFPVDIQSTMKSSPDDGEKICKHLGSSIVGDEVIFNTPEFCAKNSANCSVHFTASASNSKNKCSEFACRFPDQILLGIETSVSHATVAPTLRMTSALAAFVVIYVTSSGRMTMNE